MTYDLRVDVDLSGLNRERRNFTRNLAYSTAQALNDTAKEIQAQVRDHMAETFQIRTSASRRLLDRSIKIMAFANARAMRPYVLIGVDNTKDRLLLSMFEGGGDRTAFVGQNVAVPHVASSGARPTIESPVTRKFRFQNLNFQLLPAPGRKPSASASKRAVKRRKGPSSTYFYWQGNSGAFILQQTAKAPFGGVFRRVGKGRDDLRMLYSFRPSTKIKAELHFYRIAKTVAGERFQRNFRLRFSGARKYGIG